MRRASMADRDPESGRFLPGNIGGGRPRGSRNRLGERFLDDLYVLWESDGAKVLREARENKPMEFAKMVASLLPKELLLRKDPVDEMSDAEIADALDLLRGMMARVGGNADQTTH
jgi:hypothetical protein